MSELGLSHQEKQWIVAADDKKSKLLGQKQTLGKLVSATMSCIIPQF